ncbi:hypothetical protein AVEN_233818-1, partial [Araneus ventricosus]
MVEIPTRNGIFDILIHLVYDSCA